MSDLKIKKIDATTVAQFAVTFHNKKWFRFIITRIKNKDVVHRLRHRRYINPILKYYTPTYHTFKTSTPF